MTKRNNRTSFKKNRHQQVNEEFKTFSDKELDELIKRREQIRNEYEAFLALQREKAEKELEHYRKILNNK